MTRASPSLQQKVAFLSNPRNHADCSGDVQTIETHFAWVFLTGTHAYKLKKPVRQSEMDYRTLTARERGCRQELRLNRRLAPTVYQSVLPLTSTRGRLVLGKRGRVVDWLVKMRQLSADGMLDRALARGAVGEADIDRVTGTLARFFRRARRNPIGGERYVARLMREVAANGRALRKYGERLPQRLVEDLVGSQLQILECAHAEFAGRGRRVVEGHGDLRVEHVHLGPPVAIIDCLEFNRDLRLLDPMEEIALLALELERLGHVAVADDLVKRFRAVGNDPVTPIVLEFYQSHRATTRAKVAAWHLDDPQFKDPKPWIARTRSLLASARNHAHAALRELEHSKLGVVGGGPALQKRSERRSGEHSRNRVAKQRRDRENREAASFR